MSDLKDYPLMVTALKRLKIVPEDAKNIDTNIFFTPDLKSEVPKGTLAFISGNNHLEESFYDKVPAPLKGSKVKEKFGERAIFSLIPKDVIDAEFSDTFVHEFVHAQDKAIGKLSPSSAKQKQTLETEFSKNFQGFIDQQRRSEDYTQAFEAYKNSQKERLSMAKGKSAEEINEIIIGEFDAEAFGDNWEKVKNDWKTQWVYLQDPDEQRAWKVQISFLKHEKGLSLVQFLEHYRRSTGGPAKGALALPEWQKDIFSKWYKDL